MLGVAVVRHLNDLRLVLEADAVIKWGLISVSGGVVQP